MNSAGLRSFISLLKIGLSPPIATWFRLPMETKPGKWLYHRTVGSNSSFHFAWLVGRLGWTNATFSQTLLAIGWNLWLRFVKDLFTKLHTHPVNRSKLSNLLDAATFFINLFARQTQEIFFLVNTEIMEREKVSPSIAVPTKVNHGRWFMSFPPSLSNMCMGATGTNMQNAFGSAREISLERTLFCQRMKTLMTLSNLVMEARAGERAIRYFFPTT